MTAYTRAQTEREKRIQAQSKNGGNAPAPTSTKFDTPSFNAGSNSGLAAGKKAEADRWMNVLLTSEARGREHQAAVRLVAMPDASAAEIVAMLKGCTTDAGLHQARHAQAADANAASWKRAIERAGA